MVLTTALTPALSPGERGNCSLHFDDLNVLVVSEFFILNKKVAENQMEPGKFSSDVNPV